MEENIKFDCNKKQIIEAFEIITDFVEDMRKNNIYLSEKERLAFEELNLYIKDSIPNQKIREKIKELEGQEKWYIEHKGLDELYNQIELLKELLEEE